MQKEEKILIMIEIKPVLSKMLISYKCVLENRFSAQFQRIPVNVALIMNKISEMLNRALYITVIRPCEI